tara:strand:+ start:68 stop:292 length:225 start_codon:yes stop_codon:yes gene_type:complete
MFAEYNKQEEKEQIALLIGSVIASAEFKEAIKEAVKSGVYEDWGYDGEDEYPFDAFDEDIATNSVIEVLNKHLL